jgi:hypothetical protein
MNENAKKICTGCGAVERTGSAQESSEAYCTQYDDECNNACLYCQFSKG